jgi:hypothetical protein
LLRGDVILAAALVRTVVTSDLGTFPSKLGRRIDDVELGREDSIGRTENDRSEAAGLARERRR